MVTGNNMDQGDSMNYFKGKTVLITGAYGGFGRYFTTRLAEAGAKMILSDVVRTTLQGAARKKLHIHPGIFSKLMWQAVRLMPVIAPQRHMRHDLIA